MAKVTKEQRAVNFFTAMGLREISSRSKKYRTFLTPSSNKLYFIGHSGAVRTGKTASDSISVSDVLWKRIEAWETKNAVAELSAISQ